MNTAPPPTPKNTPGLKALAELKRIIDLEDSPDYRTASQDRALKILHLFFEEEDAEMITDALLGYVFNIILESTKTAIERSEALKTDRIQNIKDSLKKLHLFSPSKLLVSLLNSAASTALRKRPPGKTLQKSTPASDRCYICDTPLPSSHIIDHVFPKRAGGSNNHGNLRRAHIQCEAPKLSMAFPSDAAIFSFAFRNLPNSIMNESAKTYATGQPNTSTERPLNRLDLNRILTRAHHTRLRLSILARQSYTCATCPKPLTQGSSPAKRNKDLPWTFTNTEIRCPTCQNRPHAAEQASATTGC